MDRSLDQHSVLLELTPELMGILDLAGTILETHGRWQEVLGWTRQNLEQRLVQLWIHEEDVPHFQKRVQALADGESLLGFSLRLRRYDGAFQRITWKGKRVGDRIYLVSQTTEIESLVSMIDLSPDAFVSCAPDGHVLYFNQAAAILGTEKGSRKIFPFLAAEQSRHIMQDVWPYLAATGRSWEGEVTVISSEHSEPNPYWLRIHAHKAPGGQLLHFVLHASDLRQKKQEELRLIHASKLASLGEMAGGIAHEINNPLTLIQAGTRRIKRELNEKNQLTETIDGTLKSIDKTVQRISAIIRGLRAFARDGHQDQMQFVRIQDLLQDILSFSAERIKSKGIELRIANFDPELTLECRSVQVGQILLNLINNSTDAVESLKQRWIQIEVLYDEKTIKFQVTDSGEGIPKDIRDKMMSAFYTTKPAGKGTGLGLSIARSIAQSHGGQLSYDASCPNTRFVLSLPSSQSHRGAA